MAAYFGITGTPGTGKKTLAPLVAAELRVPCLGLNDLARDFNLVRRKKGDAEVDAAELGRRVSTSVTAPCLLYGHLLPFAFGREAFSKVVVLRCDPRTLKRRLAERGYGGEKIAENVVAELIGVISSESVAAFGRARVTEVDTSRGSIPAAVDAVTKCLKRAEGGRAPVDWMGSYDSAAKLRSLLGPRTPSALT
ncbi:MAG TPA: AAA family ATPase [Nitrososphaerales archaeon]|nr:AAA family ATPase [Nitrososphaerales archaeon]